MKQRYITFLIVATGLLLIGAVIAFAVQDFAG
jgi:hypothetical protein